MVEAEEENRPFADAHRPARCSSPCGALKANLQAVRNHKVAPEIYRDSCRKARMIHAHMAREFYLHRSRLTRVVYRDPFR